MANIFSDLFSTITKPFNSLFNKTGGSTSFVGVDIGSSSIKLVQLKNNRGTIVLETYGEVALGPYMEQPIGTAVNATPEIIARAMRDIITEAHITSTQYITGLPSSGVLLFTLTLPKISEQNLAEVVAHEAHKYIPIPMTEISLDWFKIPSRETYADELSGNVVDTIEVLIVAMRNDVLATYDSYTKQLGQAKPVYEVEIFSTIRSGLHHEISPVMIIDIGARSTRICIVEYGIVRVFHTVNRGGIGITESIMRSFTIPFEKAETIKHSYRENHPELEQYKALLDTGYDQIIAEAKTIMTDYQRVSEKSVTKIILSGGGSLYTPLPERVYTAFSLPTELLASFEKTEYPEFLGDILKKSGPTFGVATGLALKELI